MDITTVSFELKILSDKFYSEILPRLKESLLKEKRPYCVLLLKIKHLTFALPLRSNLPTREGVGLITIENDKGGYKGIDFSKAVIIPEKDQKSYFLTTKVQLKNKTEYLEILNKDKVIAREFKKYLSGYITAMKNNAVLDSKYEHTTLQNYHKELKISK